MFLNSLSKATLLAAVIFVSASCSSLKTSPTSRKLVFEKEWVRQTTETEFTGYRRMNRMSPLLLEQLIVQGNSIDGLVAYNRTSAAEVWRIKLENGVEGGVAASGNRLFFGSSDGQFYGVDMITGKILWSFPARAETLAAPSVENNVVYFESGADVVYALDATSGKLLWTYNRQTTTSLSIRSTTTPTIAGDKLLVGFSDGYVVALKKSDGTLIWERKLGTQGRFRDVDSTPVVNGSVLYTSSFDGALFALKVESGEVVWQVDRGGFTPVTVQGDRVYMSSSDGQLMALDKGSGKTVWFKNIKRGISTQPVYYKNFLIYGETEGNLVAADANTGEPVAQFAPGRGLIAQPTVDEKTGRIYFVSNNANLFAMKLSYIRPNYLLPWQKEQKQ